MPDFTAKMHQIRFRLGSAPDPAGGAHSAPLDPLTEFRGIGWVGKDLGRGTGEKENGEGRGGNKKGGEWVMELGGKGKWKGKGRKG